MLLRVQPGNKAMVECQMFEVHNFCGLASSNVTLFCGNEQRVRLHLYIHTCSIPQMLNF